MKMVEALKNRNKLPKIVNDSIAWPEKIPLFPVDYNWKEQTRVQIALSNVHKDTRSELWEELVKHEDDLSYCLTVMDHAGNAQNQTVGDFCGDLAYARLTGVFRQHLPFGKNRPDSAPKIGIDVGILSLKEWRKLRKEKAFYQLQIEVCEKAIANLKKIPIQEVALRDNETTQKLIAETMQKLKKTKRPILLQSSVTELQLYSDKDARKIRKEYKRKQ